MTIDEFIRLGASRLNSDEVQRLAGAGLGELTRKITQHRRSDTEQLIYLVQFFLRVAAEYDHFRGQVTLSEARRESAFVLHYFLADEDAIPDEDPDLGLEDDLIIARKVLERHNLELRDFAEAAGFDWSRLGR